MKNFLKELENSKKILITSHMSCDQDGITSALATKLIIEKNLKKKEIEVNIDSELQNNVAFLKDFDKIKTENLLKQIKQFKPDTIIFTDGQVPERFTHEYEEMEEIIKNEKIVTILIDHHDGNTKLKTKYHFNNLRSSCAEEIYFLFVKTLNFKIDRDIAEIILTGMIFDTGVFTYKNNYYRDTLNTVADLVEYGVVIEQILNHKNTYNRENLKIIAELSNNLVIKENFCYTYISDEFFEKYRKKITKNELKRGKHLWMELFLRNIENTDWGFIVYQVDKKYKVGLRSKQGGKVVRKFAEQFDGGGHDHAAGFSIEAPNVKIVIKKTLEKI